MTRGQPAVDEAGRPIVAELNRAETPDEIADRKATASARRRANQTPLNLVLALAATLGVVALIIMVVVRPTVEREPVDYSAAAHGAQASVNVPLIVPVLPPGWTANRAELVDENGIQSWQIGLLTPGEQFIGFVQGIDVDDRWISEQTQGAETTGRVTIGDRVWQVYDRRDAEDPGNFAYILTAMSGNSTIVLHGTAVDSEFETLASAVDAELDRGDEA